MSHGDSSSRLNLLVTPKASPAYSPGESLTLQPGLGLTDGIMGSGARLLPQRSVTGCCCPLVLPCGLWIVQISL